VALCPVLGQGNAKGNEMKCEICGKQYINLGVHLRHKHKIDPDDYRDEFRILRITPLVDKELSRRLSAVANRRLLDDDYKMELQEICRKNSKANKNRVHSGMSNAGKVALAKRNSDANFEYLKKRSLEVKDEILNGSGTIWGVRKKLGISGPAAKKMAKIAGIEYSSQFGKSARTLQRKSELRATAMERVKKVMVYFYTTKSAAEMCRMAGITTKTYKNWLKAGLIQRHPNSKLSSAKIQEQLL
jgi:hypothetical protein